MSKVIYKYPLQIVDAQELWLPNGAQVLTAQVQHGALQLWALVSPSGLTERVRLRIVGTGHVFPDADQWRYLSTVQVDGGVLVFHVFQEVGHGRS